MNEKNFKEAFEFLHEDLNWWILGNIPVSGTRNKKEIELGLKIIFRTFENFQFILHEFVSENEKISIIAESKAFHKRTKKNYNNHYHFLFEIKDGKIIRVKEFFDTVHALWIEEN